MRPSKKNPKVNLENYSKLFLQLGLVLSLFVAYTFIEQKTIEKKYTTLPEASSTIAPYVWEENPDVIRPKPKMPIPKPQPVIDLIVIENKKEIIESTFLVTEPDDEPVEIVSPLIEIPVDDDFKEDVPFIAIEEVPVFPGCKGNRKALSKCFSKKVQKHFSKKFNNDLPNELGLSAGKKRIHIGFKIDQFGNIVDVQARAPHPKIKKEIIKVMNLLPKMIPGKQSGVAVGVKYSIPLSLLVE